MSELPAYLFKFKRQFQRRLMLQSTFFEGATQAFIDQAQVESGELCVFDGAHGSAV